jgi:hypothetical protein
MAAQLRFMEPVSFERTVLAMQMALHQLESKMTVVGYDGRHHTRSASSIVLIPHCPRDRLMESGCWINFLLQTCAACPSQARRQ